MRLLDLVQLWGPRHPSLPRDITQLWDITQSLLEKGNSTFPGGWCVIWTGGVLQALTPTIDSGH